MMKVFDIVVDASQSGFAETELEHLLWTYLSFLSGTRQIANQDWVFARKGGDVRVRVICPEPHSLFLENATKYVTDTRNRIEAFTGKPVRFEDAGEAAFMGDYAVSPSSPFYVLRYGNYSPLLCGRTLSPVPLYKIPPTWHDGACYDDVNSWERAWKNLYGLWIGGIAGEAFACDQLERHDSEIALAGRAVCRRIEEVTGVPTYYHLFNYRGWSVAEDRARRCPETGEEWLLPKAKPGDVIAFKCDASRLTSELSPNAE